METIIKQHVLLFIDKERKYFSTCLKLTIKFLSLPDFFIFLTQPQFYQFPSSKPRVSSGLYFLISPHTESSMIPIIFL